MYSSKDVSLPLILFLAKERVLFFSSLPPFPRRPLDNIETYNFVVSSIIVRLSSYPSFLQLSVFKFPTC